MISVGIDLVEVHRIQRLVERRGAKALERLFTPGEITYAMAAAPKLRYQRLAARFAAKEALRKAVGQPVPFREMEVRSTPHGPRLLWRGQSYPVSLAHVEGLAVAVVVLDSTSSARPDP